MTKQRFKQGEIIFHEGAVSTDIYKIVSGSVDIVMNYAAENQALLLTKRTGKYFGEMAALYGEARSATALAAVSCELEVYDATELLEAEHPDFDFLDEVQMMRAADLESIMRNYLAAGILHFLKQKDMVAVRRKDFEADPKQYIEKLKGDIKTYKALDRSLALDLAALENSPLYQDFISGSNAEE